MESDRENPEHPDAGRARADAREALATLASDRAALADRVAPPRWYYPLLGAATALFVGSPGARDGSTQSVMVVFGVLGLVFLTMEYEKRTGVTVSRAAGPRSLGVAVVLGVVVVALLGVSFALEATGHRAWTGLTAVAAFAAMWGGGACYDRVYDRELRHGR
ncbi:hypothetical protein [Georgenia faecalis]|uniref:Integral membrane protein n=1 Tax=Georgenia faecalis TaxID=2483799 RepID=A0ABV9DCC4_9MICO|nr:hypothetical protein [Georgenia faecalis]